MKTGNGVVDRIGQINLQGNIIPPQWLQHVKHQSGKPNVVAIFILSEVIYWYRPTILRDDETGQIREVKKRFKADKLQRDYQSFAEQFGFTKRQVKDAIKLLEDLGLIQKEFRTVTTQQGRKANNVLFIEPVPEMIIAITFGCHTYDDTTSHLSRSSVTSMTLKRHTNTEITTKTTTINNDDDNKHTHNLTEESDGALNTDHKGDHSENKSTEGEVSQTSVDYAMQLEQVYIQRRGRGLYPSAKDLQAIQEVAQSGISFEDALLWLNEVFDNYKPKYPGDTINGFNYVKQHIYRQNYLKTEREQAAVHAREHKATFSSTQEKLYKRSLYATRPIRKELVPDWLHQDSQQEVKPPVSGSDFEEEKRKLEAELKALDAELKQAK